MDQLGVPQRRDCWICFSNENKITPTILDSEKMLQNCETYLNTSIIITSFEIETEVSFCRHCYESARRLTLLEEQIEKIQKEISDLSFLFSKSVLQRRSESSTEKGKSDNQTDECLLIHENSDCHSDMEVESLTVKNEFSESEVNELLSEESEAKTGRDNLVTDLWFDQDEYGNEAKYNCENVFRSEDDVDVKYSFDETIPEVGGTVIPNIATNQQLTAKYPCEPQSTKTSIAVLLKCLKTPIIQLERIQLITSDNSPNDVAGAVGENVKSENTMEDSSQANICSEIFSSESPFKCLEISCLKSYKSKCELVRHQRAHSSEKPYKCSLCPKTFKRSDKMKRHETIHSTEKPFKCSFCEKSFKRSDKRKDHEQIHSGEKPFQCLEVSCMKDFTSKRVLIRNQKIHSGKTLYKCSFCPKSFNCSDILKDHEITHGGEKQYKCSICSKSFARPEYLKSHERIHSKEKPIKCHFCPKSFTNAKYSRRHERAHQGLKKYVRQNKV